MSYHETASYSESLNGPIYSICQPYDLQHGKHVSCANQFNGRTAFLGVGGHPSKSKRFGTKK